MSEKNVFTVHLYLCVELMSLYFFPILLKKHFSLILFDIDVLNCNLNLFMFSSVFLQNCHITLKKNR